jgi:hypothetical protein
VVQDEELGHLALARSESEPLAERGHQLAPADGVISSQSLPGVVEQHPQVEGQRILEVGDHPRELRLDVHQVPGAQRVQPPERPEGVNVHRVHVVQVVLVVRGDPPELGHQRPQHPEGVHLVQHRPAPRRREEQRLGRLHRLGVAPGGHQGRQRLGDPLAGPAVDRDAELARVLEQSQRLGGRALEQRRVVHRQPPAEHLEVSHLALGAEDAPGRALLLARARTASATGAGCPPPGRRGA